MINTKDEYINAVDLKDDLFGALVFINPQLRDTFIKDHQNFPFPLKEVFRVTNLSDETICLLHHKTISWVDKTYFKTKNPHFKF